MKEVNDNETIFVRFVAPKIIAFEDYRFYLLKNSETKPLKPVNYYRPDYVSFEEYDTINLWAMLMFINNVPSLEDFERETILVPTAQSILDVSRNVMARDLVHELVPLSDLPPKETPPLFSRVVNIPYHYIVETPKPTFTSSDMYFYREQFTVDNVMARDRYVDLKFDPVPESLTFKVKDNPSYIYGKHYNLIRGSKSNNRLTWDPKKISNGSGLMSVLVEGITFEVNYAKKVIV